MNENEFSLDDAVSKEAQDGVAEMLDLCFQLRAYDVAERRLEDVRTTFIHYDRYRQALDYLVTQPLDIRCVSQVIAEDELGILCNGGKFMGSLPEECYTCKPSVDKKCDKYKPMYEK